MSIADIIETIDARFKSANSVPVERAPIKALRAALAEYPKRNPQQLQAAKVCNGVLALAGSLAAATDPQPGRVEGKS